MGHLWLINPLLRTLEVMRLETGRWFVSATFRGDAPVRAEPFESVELSLGDLWGPPRRS